MNPHAIAAQRAMVANTPDEALIVVDSVALAFRNWAKVALLAH